MTTHRSSYVYVGLAGETAPGRPVQCSPRSMLRRGRAASLPYMVSALRGGNGTIAGASQPRVTAPPIIAHRHAIEAGLDGAAGSGLRRQTDVYVDERWVVITCSSQSSLHVHRVVSHPLPRRWARIRPRVHSAVCRCARRTSRSAAGTR